MTGEYRRVISDALKVSPQSSNRYFAQALEMLKPEAFIQALKLCKQAWLDLIEPGARVKIFRDSSEENYGQISLVVINELGDVDDDEHAVLLPPLRDFFARDLLVAVVAGVEISRTETIPMRAGDVYLMVRNGSNVNDFGPVGHTALWLACNRGNYELTKALLKSGASAERADGLRRCTPLHFLSRFEPKNIREIADLLVKAGADLEAINKQGQTPLMAAISPQEQPMSRSALPAVRALLALGASPVAQMQDDRVLSFGHGEGTLPDCPVTLACASLELDIFELLMDRIRQLGSSPAGLRRLVQAMAESMDVDEREVVRNKTEALSFYMVQLKAHCFALAIQRPPVVAPVLHRNWEQKGGYKDPVHRLVAYLLDPDLMLFFSNMKYSPLHQAITKGAFDFVEIILRMGKFEKSDLTSRRVLEAAFQRRSIELIERLVRSGFEFDKETLGDGEIFLHLAIASNWTVDMLSKVCGLAKIKLILPALASVRDDRGATPFASAVIKGHFAVAGYLAQLLPRNTIDAQTFVLDSGHDAYCSVFPFGWPCVSLWGYCLGGTADEGLKVQQAKYLLKFKPAFRVSQTHGCTALTLCWKDWKYHQKRSLSPKLESSYSATLVDILLQHYAEKELLNQADYLGNTPLHYACASGNVHGVQRLLEAGADINAMDHSGMTPLDVVDDQGFFVLQHGQNGSDPYMDQKSEELRLFEAVQLEVSVFFELHQLLSAKGGLTGKACLGAKKKKPIPGSECRLAEDCHRVKTALWRQFGVTRLTRQPGSIHTFMLEEAHRKPEGWTKPVELADSDAEAFPASGTQTGSSSTAVQIGGDEVKTTQQNKTWKIDNIPGLEEYLAKPGWCAKVRSVVVHRAGNHLKETGIMTRNRANRKAASLDQQLRCTKTAEQIQEILGKHPRVETGLRRLIARLAAGSVADLAAKSLVKNDREQMEYYEKNQLQLLKIRAMAQCRFLKELHGISGQGDCIGKALATIL
ncbi:Ankyrin repeat-containing domain protein [Rhypophila sp. PSN 637]